MTEHHVHKLNKGRVCLVAHRVNGKLQRGCSRCEICHEWIPSRENLDGSLYTEQIPPTKRFTAKDFEDYTVEVVLGKDYSSINSNEDIGNWLAFQ